MSGGLEGLLAGRTLVKRYEIGDVIGRGGFAVVYRAMDRRLGRPVAVKVITLVPHDEHARGALRERFQREARAAAGLPHHPNLVAVHDVGTDPELGIDFLVMELLEGENLSEHLRRRGRLPTAEGLRILRAAAEGVAVGHRAGLVHRDVKPGNLFLAAGHGEDVADRRVCVLDYGIAKAMEEDATLTRAEAAPFSPAFASPEQLRGDRAIGPASDVFSLAVVGYELLTGERPFSGGPGQPPSGWTLHRPLREANPEVPPGVEAVVVRALSVDPAERPPDADAFARELDAAAGAPLPPDDATVLAPAVAAGPETRAGPARPEPVARRRRRVGPAGAALLLALLVAGVALWAALSGRGGGGAADAGGPSAAGEVDGGGARLPAGAGAEPAPGAGAGGAGAGASGPDQPAAAEEAEAVEEPGGERPPPAVGTPAQPPAGAPAPPPAGPAEPPPARRPEPAPAPPESPPARPPAQAPARPPAQAPAEPPAQPPVEPVIVVPRPAPPDTIRIGPPG
jgi:eukaryotic-like serine/threonine-protein kinase